MSQIDKQADNLIAEGHAIPSNLWGELVPAEAESIKSSFLEIQNKIAPCKPKIIGVTKYFGLNAILNGYEAGLRNFGESRVLDAVEKLNSLPKEIKENSNFHFIGHLQTNKASKAVEYFDYIHSVDSLKLATVISKAATSIGKTQKIFLQVNIAKEEQKTGYSEADLIKDLPEILKLSNLEIVGLMNMAPLGAPETELRKIFSTLRELRNHLELNFNISLPELSMGMSDDYHIAVQEGATMIRIGRKLFK